MHLLVIIGEYFPDGMDHYCTFPTITIGDPSLSPSPPSDNFGGGNGLCLRKTGSSNGNRDRILDCIRYMVAFLLAAIFFSDGMDHYCTFPTITIGDTYDVWRDPRVPIVDVRAVVLFHRQIMTPERTQFNAVTRLVLSRYVNTGTYCMLTCRTRVILNNTS